MKFITLFVLLIIGAVWFHRQESTALEVSYQNSGETIAQLAKRATHVVVVKQLLRKAGDVAAGYWVRETLKSPVLKKDSTISVVSPPAYMPDASGANPIIMEYQPSYPKGGKDEEIILFLTNYDPDQGIYMFIAEEGIGALPQLQKILQQQGGI